jgi:hypothetical protein
MSFTGNFMATSFKQEVLQGVHNFTNGTGNTFKLALYTNSASFTAATTAYTSSNEVSASGSYSAGGGALTNVTPTTSGTTGFADFNDLTFTSATITARGNGWGLHCCLPNGRRIERPYQDRLRHDRCRRPL